MAPTGAGKTYLGHRIALEALMKGRSVVFVCDRTTLINQTSATADAYGLSAHGIVQAKHGVATACRTRSQRADPGQALLLAAGGCRDH